MASRIRYFHDKNIPRWKLALNEPAPGAQTNQSMDLISDLMRHRRRLMTMLPEDVALLKAQLEKLKISDGLKHFPDRDLIYRVGAVLFAQSEAISMGELSKALEVPFSTATRIVDSLVESGFAERVPDAEDRRIVRVALTKTGQDLYQTLHQFMRQRVEHLLQLFTSEERDQLIYLLRKAVNGLDGCETNS